MTQEVHSGIDGTPLFDSGYTDDEIDAIFESLVKGEEMDVPDGFWCGLMIGLWDDDLLPLMDDGPTMMLQTPRDELDRRIAAVRAAIAGGATLQQAVEGLPDSSK